MYRANIKDVNRNLAAVLKRAKEGGAEKHKCEQGEKKDKNMGVVEGHKGEQDGQHPLEKEAGELSTDQSIQGRDTYTTESAEDPGTLEDTVGTAVPVDWKVIKHRGTEDPDVEATACQMSLERKVKE